MIDLYRAARLLVLLLPLSLSGCFGVMSAKDLSADLPVATPLEPGTYVAVGTAEPQKPFALTKADDGTYAIETDDPTDTLKLRLLALPNLPADTYLVSLTTGRPTPER